MKKILIILLVAGCLVSCRKFLAEYSPSDVTPKTTSDFGEILYADGYPDAITPIQPWMVFLDDDIQCYVGKANELANKSFMAAIGNIYHWQPEMTSFQDGAITDRQLNAWGNYYKMLLGVNVALQHLDNSTGSQEQKDRFKGEAFGLRAYYHFMLVNIYALPYNDSLSTPDKLAGVPIRTTADLSDQFLTRNSVKEVYQQITRDLDSSLALLSKSREDRDVFRLSYTAVQLLASRVYLYMEDWQKSITHANEVIQYHPMLMDYNKWTNTPPAPATQFIGPGNAESIWCYGTFTEHYSLSWGFGRVFDISKNLFDCFEETDLRRQNGIQITPEPLKEYIVPDYLQSKLLSLTGRGRETITNSWRSAEAYLNKAEACIQLYRSRGDAAAAAEALSSLNTLRAQRFHASTFRPWAMDTGDKLLEMCRQERRRELYMEEAHRWFDLRRYGMPEIRHISMPDRFTVQYFTLKKRDPQYVVPIPKNVIERNPALIRNPVLPGMRMPD
ncbi:RagB/SusD family nutrient uptake outer membrane protein [Chitinophaga sp. Mgbs1]|uniref:RagB/SusD family nutrient uptake outer membrane protein n=1 Tax=Chitinophaga solisilvae TaxID=1233460 RepID=A0A3S1D373_9BACT|nr:RagB/SusD family nutrient uptake outer membrane protein [Chitinophaga solisilvae]